MGSYEKSLSGAAPPLPKLRRPRKNAKNPGPLSVADVDEYNNRQLLRCVETRQRKTSGGGISAATEVALIEVAKVRLPSNELAAYMAKHHGTQREINLLVDKLEVIITRAAKVEQWPHQDSDKMRLLASIVVEAWLHPAKFWRDSGSPYVSSFARIMKCDRKTWRSRWHLHFIAYSLIPEGWCIKGERLLGEFE